MARKMTVEDFENDGFVVYNERTRPKKANPKEPSEVPQKQLSKNPAKIIIMDNKDVLAAVKESNEALKAGLEQLIYSMESKPESFTLNIERDQRGFMTKIKVKVNK